MPKELDDCVRKVQRKGYTKDQAYAICAKSTGYTKKKGGGWKKKKRSKK